MPTVRPRPRAPLSARKIICAKNKIQKHNFTDSGLPQRNVCTSNTKSAHDTPYGVPAKRARLRTDITANSLSETHTQNSKQQHHTDRSIDCSSARTLSSLACHLCPRLSRTRSCPNLCPTLHIPHARLAGPHVLAKVHANDITQNRAVRRHGVPASLASPYRRVHAQCVCVAPLPTSQMSLSIALPTAPY